MLRVVGLVGRRLEGRRRGELVGRRGTALRLDRLGLLRDLRMLARRLWGLQVNLLLRGWPARLRLLLLVLMRLKLRRKLLRIERVLLRVV